jgi:hypothetical protein
LKIPVAAATLLLLIATARSQEPAGRGEVWDGSRTTPVHRLVLTDEAGDAIVPALPGAPPYSSRQTCGSCHDYAAIAGGFHFSPDVPASQLGRPAQPWFWVDSATGTQIPVSGHGWPQTWKPADLGLTPWQCTKLWGRHFPGGGWGEPADEFADPEARWDVSGKVDVHCQACHGASPRQDPSEWAKQIARENFRWAATAADGFGDVGGMASRVRESWRQIDGPNPDDHQYAVPPYIRYDQGQFDAKHRTLIDLSYRPPDRNCLFCHSVTPVNSERWQVDGDVHSRAGLQCADCHRNGQDHQVIRGYEGEPQVGTSRGAGDFSCRGCHLGTDTAGTASAGRLGEPRPLHRGLPPSHFEKLSCTVCHSSYRPQEEPQRVRTARANRLGVHGRAQWFTSAPQIVEPVFMKTFDGKIAPHRMAWPAFWARTEGGKTTPLRPEAVTLAGKGILDAAQQVAGILSALRRDVEAPAPAVLVMDNAVYEPTADGRVQTQPAPAGGAGGVLVGAAGSGWAVAAVAGFRSCRRPRVCCRDPPAGDAAVLVAVAWGPRPASADRRYEALRRDQWRHRGHDPGNAAGTDRLGMAAECGDHAAAPGLRLRGRRRDDRARRSVQRGPGRPRAAGPGRGGEGAGSRLWLCEFGQTVPAGSGGRYGAGGSGRPGRGAVLMGGRA